MACCVGIIPLPIQDQVVKDYQYKKQSWLNVCNYLQYQNTFDIIQKVQQIQTRSFKSKEMKFKFSPFMIGSDDNVRTLSVGEIVEDIKKGNNFYCEKLGEKWYGKNSRTKFFIDLDLDWFNTKEEALIHFNNKTELEIQFYEHIQMVFNRFCDFPVGREQVDFVWRKGGIKPHKNLWKISCRVIVQVSVKYVNLSLFMTLLKRKFIEQFDQQDIVIRGIYSDISAYQNKQMNCMWCRKKSDSVEKNRVFEPDRDLNVDNFLYYLINYVEGLPEVDLEEAIRKLEQDFNSCRSVVPTTQQQQQVVVYQDKDSVVNPNEIKKLIALLPANVANNQSISLNVQYACKVLGNQLGNIYMFFEDFVKFIQQKDFFASQSYNYVYDYVKNEWFDKLNYSEKRIGVNYLRNLVEQFQPNEYSLFKQRRIFSSCDKTEIIEYLEQKFYGRVVYCNKKYWISFNETNNMWQISQNTPLVIEKFLSGDLAGEFKERSIFLTEMLENSSDIPEDQIKKIKKQISQNIKAYEWCRDPNQQDTFIKKLRNRLEDDTFLDKFDMRRDCINFENGYVVLGPDTYEFKQRDNSVFFTKSTKYDFKEFDQLDKVDQIMPRLNDCFDHPNKLEFLLDCAAYAISGERYAEKFLSMVGDTGRNGKGMFDSLMSGVLGGYYASINIQYFIGTQSATTANDQELSLRHCRWITTTEPRFNRLLNEGKVKQITGNDEYQARVQYGTTQYFRPQGFMVFQSNMALAFDNFTEAMESRRMVLNFPYQFKESLNDIKDPESQKLQDPTLKSKIQDLELRQQFMLFLIKRYYEKGFHKKTQISIPQEVKDIGIIHSQEMIEDFLQVIKRICVITGNDNDFVWHDDLLTAYNFYSTKEMSTHEFKKNLRAPTNLFMFENTRKHKEGTKAHRVKYLRLKQRIHETLFGFEQFLYDTYYEKIQNFIPIALYQLRNDYNLWLASHQEYNEYYILNQNLRILIEPDGHMEQQFGGWTIFKYDNERFMYKLVLNRTMAEQYFALRG